MYNNLEQYDTPSFVSGSDGQAGHKAPEERFWLAYINLMVNDAIYPFKIPTPYRGGSDSIAKQYEKKLNALKRGGELSRIEFREADMRNAYEFLESDRLEKALELAGYDCDFAQSVFDFCQEIITLRKGLYETAEKMQKSRKLCRTKHRVIDLNYEQETYR